MAKQSGLHQIRGKVGEHSYYRQTGVSAGLIRSINQGLSSRVKTGAEYVNTRLNNAEFGQACTIAAKLISYITPKYRPMILPFSQAKLAKDILEVIKTDSANWGQRNITDADGSELAPLLSTLAKNDFDEFGIDVYGEDDLLHVDASASVQYTEKLAALGADGCLIRAVVAKTYIGKYNSTAQGYVPSKANANIYNADMTQPDNLTIDAQYPAGTLVPLLQTDSTMVVIVVMPYRTINSVKHVLQEACTFKSVPEIAFGD